MSAKAKAAAKQVIMVAKAKTHAKVKAAVQLLQNNKSFLCFTVLF